MDQNVARRLEAIRCQRASAMTARGTGHHADGEAPNRAYAQGVDSQRLGDKFQRGKSTQNEVDDYPAVGRMQNQTRGSTISPRLPQIEPGRVRRRNGERDGGTVAEACSKSAANKARTPPGELFYQRVALAWAPGTPLLVNIGMTRPPIPP